MENPLITQYSALFKSLHIIGTRAQAHCLLILPHNYELTAGGFGHVINLSQVKTVHLLQDLI